MKRRIRRPNDRADQITIAGLTGASVRLAEERGDRGAAVAALAADATQPDPENGRMRVRAELLEDAAGHNLASWQADPVGAWLGRDAALLLVDAGADPQRVKEIAAAYRERWSAPEPPGIGNPQQRGPTDQQHDDSV